VKCTCRVPRVMEHRKCTPVSADKSLQGRSIGTQEELYTTDTADWMEREGTSAMRSFFRKILGKKPKR